jgi:hypothetical protein
MVQARRDFESMADRWIVPSWYSFDRAGRDTVSANAVESENGITAVGLTERTIPAGIY